MKHQLKPNRWSCALTAFAMALDVGSVYLTELIGHDGSDVLFPELPEPMCRRGFHIQELIHAALTLRHTVTPYELIPAIQSTPHPGSPPRLVTVVNSARKPMFTHLVAFERGVITGHGNRCHHAMAFDRGLVLDPDGGEFHFSFANCEARNFYAQCVWLIQPLNDQHASTKTP